jgi:hypothetical protein
VRALAGRGKASEARGLLQETRREFDRIRERLELEIAEARPEEPLRVAKERWERELADLERELGP